MTGHRRARDTFPVDCFRPTNEWSEHARLTSGILITVSRRILIGGGGGAALIALVSIADSSVVSVSCAKPCVILRDSNEPVGCCSLCDERRSTSAIDHVRLAVVSIDLS